MSRLVCFVSVTFQHIEALLVRRVRIWVIWGTEGAAISGSYPVSTTRRFNWF